MKKNHKETTGRKYFKGIFFALCSLLFLLFACENPFIMMIIPDKDIDGILLEGSAEITGTYRIGEQLTVDTSGINAGGTFNYAWKADSNAIGSNSANYTIQGSDAGKTITCVITHGDFSGSVTATGNKVPYDIDINLVNNQGADAVTASPDHGHNGAGITLNYTVHESGKLNYQIIFSGASSIGPVNSAEEHPRTGTRPYTLAASDAAAGVITIIATFTHSDKAIDTIAFADTNNEEKTYGDLPFTKAITNTGSGIRAITYSSSDTGVATVSPTSGEVTILKAGTTTITAKKAGDETWEEATASYLLTVSKKQLTISGTNVATTKKFDGNTTATVNVVGTLIGVMPSDIVNVSAEANYDSASVGESKQITVVYTIFGTDSENYIKPVDFKTTGSIKADDNDPNVNPIVDFEDDIINITTYNTTKDGSGGSAGTAIVVADPINNGQKSLEIKATNYNHGAIIPIHLPKKLSEYKQFSFRFNVRGGTDLGNKKIQVYAASNPAQFLDGAFGNKPGDEYPPGTLLPDFDNLLLGETASLDFTASGGYQNTWSWHTIPLTNPGNAVKDLQGTVYIAIGVNHGNITLLVDDLTFELPTVYPPAPNPPATGAVFSGNYRNLFKEFGKTDAEIKAKVDNAWTKLFDLNSTAAAPGTSQTSSANTRFYYETTLPSGQLGAFILDSGSTNFRPTGDVRSEGMSYGMMIAVQLDQKDQFDRLWRWARTYMYNETHPSGSKNSRAYFSWAVDPVTFQTIDPGIAPDGEFYFATALLFASARWGDNTGAGTDASMLNYGQHARRLLYDMINRDQGGIDPYEPGLFRRSGDSNTALPGGVGYHQPVFSPYGNSAGHTDPSYHLPAFYEIWAMELEADHKAGKLSGIWSNLDQLKADIDFYKKAAETSRSFFPTTAKAPTYLGPDYALFNGTPTGGQHAAFRYDAWRIAMNIGMDYAWFAEDPWQKTFANGIQTFFASKGVTSYGTLWELNGTGPLQNGEDHSPGLVACNAVASLAATNQLAWEFVEDFWNAGMTTGQYRYYDGCLYMLGLLHVSGNFKAYLSSNTTPIQHSSISPTSGEFNKRAQQNITVTMTLNGNTLERIENAGTELTRNTHYTVSGSIVTLNSSYMESLSNGAHTLTFIFSAGTNRNFSLSVIDEAPSATFDRYEAEFDKFAQQAITVTMTMNGNTLTGINNGGTALSGSNYSTGGNSTTGTITLNTTYLSTLPLGETTLTFVFTPGANRTFVITVTDTAPSAELSITSAQYDIADKKTIPVTITWNGNSLSSIHDGNRELVSPADYATSGNLVTLTMTYLDSITLNTTRTLTFNFSGGMPSMLEITAIDSAALRTSFFFENLTSAFVDPLVGLSPIAITQNAYGRMSTSNPGTFEVRLTQNYSNQMVFLEFNLGSESLEDYDRIRFVWSVSGDTGNDKQFRIEATTGALGNRGQNTPIYGVNLVLPTAETTSTLTLSGTRSALTGKVHIGIGGNINASYFYIKSIELLKPGQQ
ncbi:MAG: Ig-like domain-containing protein [Treponema sp.]|jgi:endo-1,4-beta-D-glucanase Y|nr:Ig-like domain-containing protein [Treponema sp.]